MCPADLEIISRISASDMARHCSDVILTGAVVVAFSMQLLLLVSSFIVVILT